MSLAYAKTYHRRRGTYAPAGVSLLDPVITLNGVAKSPLLQYYGGDAGASAWAQQGVAGGSLAIAGAGGAPTLGVATCFASDLGVTLAGGAGGKYYQSAGTTVGQVTTEDLVWELVIKHVTAGANHRLFQKSTAGLVGWTIYHDAGSNKVYGYFHDGANTVLPTSPSAMVVGRYYHYFIYMDRSEASTNGCAIIMNGTAGTGVDPSALLTITNAGHLTIGAAEDGSSNSDNTIVQCTMWSGAGWLAGGAGGAAAALALAQARYAQLKGIGG